MVDITQILLKIETGAQDASQDLLPLVYDELRKLAAARMASERPDHTLQATALVHDAYLRLVDVKQVQHWNSRGHFFAAAAEAMRRILVEHARKKAGPVAGGAHQRVSLTGIEAETAGPSLNILALDEALDRLAAEYPRVAEVVKLRFFAGLSRQDVATALGVSLTTVDDDWAYARGRLNAELCE